MKYLTLVRSSKINKEKNFWYLKNEIFRKKANIFLLKMANFYFFCIFFLILGFLFYNKSLKITKIGFLPQLLVLPLQLRAPSEEEETASDTIGVETTDEQSTDNRPASKETDTNDSSSPSRDDLVPRKRRPQLSGQMSQQRVSTQELLRIRMSW